MHKKVCALVLEERLTALVSTLTPKRKPLTIWPTNLVAEDDTTEMRNVNLLRIIIPTITETVMILGVGSEPRLTVCAAQQCEPFTW